MIDQFLEMLGVELNEDFNIGGLIGGNPHRFEIRDGCFHLVDNEGDSVDDYIALIVSGRFKIEKMQWKPKDGDTFYCIAGDDEIRATIFNECYFPDLYCFQAGNCFKTREEAEAHKDEVLKRFKEIREELNA